MFHAPAPKPNFETLCKTKSIKKMVCAKDSKDLWPQRWHNHFTIFIAMFIVKIVRLAPCSHALAALRFALSIVDKTFENWKACRFKIVYNGCGQIKFYCGLCGLWMDVGAQWPKQSEYYMAMAVGRLCEGTMIFITRGSSLRRIGQFHMFFSHFGSIEGEVRSTNALWRTGFFPILVSHQFQNRVGSSMC